MSLPESSEKELSEAPHEAWPGYPRILAGALAAAAIWLLIVFLWGVNLGVYTAGGH